MKKPTYEEVFKEMKKYGKEKGYTFRDDEYAFQAEDFVDYYESVGWRVGNKAMKSWPHAAKRWIRFYWQRKARWR